MNHFDVPPFLWYRHLMTFTPPATCSQLGTSTARRAFTLLELMVVIVIIALLAGMLVPGISLVKSGAKSAVCQSRYRQMAVVFDNYLSNNDQTFPPASGWYGFHTYIDLLLETHVLATNEYAKMFMCGEDRFRPADIVSAGRWGGGLTVWDKDGQSHGYNSWGIGGSGGGWGTHIMTKCAVRNEIKYPEATILSTCTLQTGPVFISGYIGNGYGYAQSSSWGATYPRHRGNTVINVLWVDYHVSGVQAAGPGDKASLSDPLRLGLAPPSITPSTWDRD